MILISFGIIFLIVFLYYVRLDLWLTAQFSGVHLDLTELIFMKIRKSPVNEIVNSLITCTKSGVEITRVELETHALAGGNVIELSKALITAKRLGIEVSIQELSAMDLIGKNLAEFLELRKNQSANYIEKRENIAKVIVEQLTDNEVDELERYLSRIRN